MSVAVNVSPPNTSAREPNSYPTDSGPTVSPSASTTEPPPIPIEKTSGIRKLVRTPATVTSVVASLGGKPLVNTPTSVVVPPDVDHRTAGQTGQNSGASHGVGRPRSESRHRITPRVLDVHQGSVVLAQVQRRDNAVLDQRSGKTVDDVIGELAQRSIDDGRVLPLE